MTITAVGTIILIALGVWLFGGLALRFGGALLAFTGVVSLTITGNPAALVVAVLGFVLWLAGHWHFALRHHEYKSPLARRIFLQALPPRLDPTRRWGVPVVDDERGEEPAPPRDEAEADR
jgi:hypothetical protein